MIERTTMQAIIDEYFGRFMDLAETRLKPGAIPEVRCIVPALDPVLTGGTVLEDTIVFEGGDDDE